MSSLDSFLIRCDDVAARLNIARATLSTRLFADGKRLDAIAAGSDVGARRLARAVEGLDEIEAAGPRRAERRPEAPAGGNP